MARGKKTGGRAKGTPNKITHDVRQCILDVAERLGGTERLLAWALENSDNERIFWSGIYLKVLPREIRAEHSGPDGTPISQQVDARIQQQADNRMIQLLADSELMQKVAADFAEKYL